MLVVIALGGNALLRRGEALDADVQRRNVQTAAAAVAEVVRDHEVVVTHGNGPQVGLLALQGEAFSSVHPYPLDVLGAESAGMIGYVLDQELTNQLPEREVATLLTQVVVEPDDPAFSHPTKPIGPVFSEADARRLAHERGWAIAPDDGGWRRVVPSPEPCEIVELATIETLVNHDVVVVCSGGGGIPVVLDERGYLHGVEAVIDKDLAATLLAERLGADALLLLTDVDAVYDAWGTADARAIRRATAAELRAKEYAAGSMGPKVEAACRFVEATGHAAAIGALVDAAAILRGDAGTTVALLRSGA